MRGRFKPSALHEADKVIGDPNCGREPDEPCGMEDPDDCAIHGVEQPEPEPVPIGDCGRPSSIPCGLKIQTQCFQHFNDPPTGGAFGFCGRPEADPCGMKHPDECTIHCDAKKRLSPTVALQRSWDAVRHD